MSDTHIIHTSVRKNFFYQNLKSAFLAEFNAEESPLLPCLNAEDYGQKHHKRMKILRKSAQSDREMVQKTEHIGERKNYTHGYGQKLHRKPESTDKLKILFLIFQN